MDNCEYCGHDEFLVAIPNAVISITVNSDEDYDFQWMHEYCLGDPGSPHTEGLATLRCKGCGNLSTELVEDLGMSECDDNFGSLQ